jgi:hypothetical protein
MIDKLIEPVSKILDKFVADKDLKAKLQHELNTELHKANMAQLEVNKVEAAHKNMFVAGWRPFVGWCCASALAYHFILQPILVFVLSISGYQVALPEFDMSSLMTVLLGMLGLGGMRTLEKVQKVSREK